MWRSLNLWPAELQETNESGARQKRNQTGAHSRTRRSDSNSMTTVVRIPTRCRISAIRGNGVRYCNSDSVSHARLK
jgi:hypothetical protein